MDFHGYDHYSKEEDQVGEDDGFYDELRKQILQLTAEDNDVHLEAGCDRNKILISRIQARKRGPLQQPLCYYNWPGIKEDCTATTPAWMLNLWRTGTGVFIPQTLHSSMKNTPIYCRKEE